MKVKTSELTGVALDWAVVMAYGLRPTMRHDYMLAKTTANNYKGDLAWCMEVTPNEPITVDEAGVTHMLRAYSEQWSQGGPLIQRENIGIERHRLEGDYQWAACDWHSVVVRGHECLERSKYTYGPTQLVAAMRCLVMKHLGNEVDIPEELL